MLSETVCFESKFPLPCAESLFRELHLGAAVKWIAPINVECTDDGNRTKIVHCLFLRVCFSTLKGAFDFTIYSMIY